MKKSILSLVAVAAIAGLSSCGNKNADSFDAADKALGDSLATAYGEFMGARANSEFDRQVAEMTEEQKANFSRADFLRGMKAVATRDTASMSYMMGVQYGMNIWGAARGIPSDLQVPADAAVMLAAFEKVFNADSVGDMYAYQAEFQQLMQRAQEYAQEKEERRLAESEEAVANKAAGEEYINKLVADSAYTRTESGLAYKITEQGQGETVKANDRLKLRYIGRHIDGTVFDQTREEPMTAFAGRFVPGFSEGLQLLAPGGKATIVLPADLAYGVRGTGGDIKPNETLIFDIEIVEVLD